MKITFNPSTVAALTSPPNNKDITFDLKGHNIFARGVEFKGTDTNTWRDIKINNVSIGSNILDLCNGTNTTLTNINGVVTINSTWRPIVDNLTSNSTTSSLSANQGRVLKALIDGKSDSGHNHDDRYLRLIGGTLSGALSIITPSFGALIIQRNDTTNGASIQFKGSSSIYGYIGFNKDSKDKQLLRWNSSADTSFSILDTSTTYVSSNKGYINGTEITQVNNANKWTAARTFTIGNTSKNVDGSNNVSWSLSEIGAASSGHNHDGRYVRAFGTSNDNIDSDWGQSFKTFDPIPSGTPPEKNPNISLLSIGENFNRRKQLAFVYSSDNIYYRRHVDDGFTNWKRIAFANEIPSSLKNPHALTISLNGTSQGPYDGSVAMNINITPGSIGAATSDHNHDGRYVRYYAVTTLDCNNLAAGLTVASVNATNAGAAYHSAYLYISDVGTPFQIQIPDSGTSYIYKRYYSSGKWSGWFKLNAGYADSAGSVAWADVTGKPSSFTPSAHTHAWNSLTHSSTTENQAILTNGKANGWKLYTLNISGWNNAANNAHSHSNKLVLDGITSALISSWNTAYSFVDTITKSDTDKVINKWSEIVNFLSGISSDNKLNTLLNSKLSVYELTNNTNVGTIKNNGIYYSTTDASSGTLTNSPFNNGFTLINMTSLDGGDDLRRSRLAFNGYGEIKVSNDRGQTNTAETWYQVLTSHNTYISNGTGIINGATITQVANATNASVASKVYGQVGDTGSHELVRCDMNNDQFRIIAGSSNNNNGWAEIATSDDGNEPIYVRQYTGVFGTVKRTLTLLDANGYSHFPSYINIGGNENNNSSPDRVWGSNSSDSYLRSYRTSALRVAYAASANSATTASSANKLTTARNITLGTDLRGSANFDGSSNITINAHINSCKTDVGSTNELPFKRIAHYETRNSWNDNALLLYISQGYINGCNGICRVEFRTDNISSSNSNPTAAASASVRWLVRNGYNLGSLYAGYYVTTDKAYIDIYLKTTGSYQGTVIRVLQDSRGNINSDVQLINSYYYSDTNHAEAYNSIEAASTALYNRAYTRIVSGNDIGTVSYSNSTGSVHWNNVTNKPSAFTPSYHTHTWTSITDKIVLGNEFNIVNAGFNSEMWFNYLPINDRSETAAITEYDMGNGAGGYAPVRASGFIKNGGNGDQLLRADGGVSNFYWYGQSGQPTWLWGGNNHHSYYVYNPSNFRVAYAETAGSADNIGGVPLSGIFTAFGNNGNNITATIGGITKEFQVNYAINADKLDGYHENSFLRYRGYTNTDQEDTLWDQIGIKEYANALPDNLTGAYNYGSVISLPSVDFRFEIYAPDWRNGGQLYYRSGYLNDKKPWYKFIDSSNIGSQSVNYANSAGDASTLGGIPRSYGQTPFSTIPCIASNGVMEIGRYIDYHYDNSGKYDFSTRLQVGDNYSNIVTLPSRSGTLALTSDILNCYWANVKISTSANTQTTPSVNTIFANNWFRSQGDTGWYNESYGGGIHMTDTEWIRTFGGKSFYCDSQISSYGFHHLNHDNNDAVLLAGGDWRLDNIQFRQDSVGQTYSSSYPTTQDIKKYSIYQLQENSTLHLPKPTIDLIGTIVFVKSSYGSGAKVSGIITPCNNYIGGHTNTEITRNIGTNSMFYICMNYGLNYSWVEFYCG